MRAVQKYVLCLLVLLSLVAVARAQMPPNLENGFKNWGSYDSTKLDTVNTLNGNQMLHAPLLPNYPQRGGSLTMQSLLYQTSKTWQASCSVDFNGQVTCQWAPGRQGANLRQSEGLTIQRPCIRTPAGRGKSSIKRTLIPLKIHPEPRIRCLARARWTQPENPRSLMPLTPAVITWR